MPHRSLLHERVCVLVWKPAASALGHLRKPEAQWAPLFSVGSESTRRGMGSRAGGRKASQPSAQDRDQGVIL